MLGDLTGSTSAGKKEDTYVAKNEKTSELWRPGANFKPTYFNEAKGPKVGPSCDFVGIWHSPCCLSTNLQCKWPYMPRWGSYIQRPHEIRGSQLAAVQLAFVTTTSESFKQIELWIDYHKSIGVNHFYLFVDGQVQQLPCPTLLELCAVLRVRYYMWTRGRYVGS